MNRYKIFLLLSLPLLLATGCSKKFLEEMKSYNEYDESIFTNETQTGWYIDRMYNDYFASYKSPVVSVIGRYDDAKSKMTDEFGGTIADQINASKTLINPTSDVDTYYGTVINSGVNNNPYTRIRNCNFLFDKLEQYSANYSEEFKKNARGQSYFLRALQYFDLVRIYGGVPIVLTVEAASSQNEAIKIPRAKTSEVIAQIVKDLDSAAHLLPLTWDANNWGRLSGAGALAMKSRVLLTAASPLFNATWDDAGSDRWQKALDAGLAAETALQSGGYGLYGTSAKDWAEMWYINDNKFISEAIMVQLMSSATLSSGILSNSWERSIRLARHAGGDGQSVPKGMIDLFPLADGTRPQSGVNYVDSLFFMNRDPRFYRTFAFTGSKWSIDKNSDTVFIYRWKNGNTPLYAGNASTKSPVVVRKMSSPNAASANLAFSGTDIMEYRYAELLLNIAECYAAKNDIANCVKYLGKIRARVGIPAANNWGIGNPANKYKALEACLYERRVELAYEGKRFWDLQRWCLYSDEATFGNTCTKLGITPLNGTSRKGYYWQYKGAGTAADPLLAQRKVFVDPDAANFATQLNDLKTFFQANFNVTQLDQIWDLNPTTNTENLITFRPNYYVSGIPSAVLSLNPWILQTSGWNDYNGALGTYNYRD